MRSVHRALLSAPLIALALLACCGGDSLDLLRPPEGAGRWMGLVGLGDLDGDGRAERALAFPLDSRSAPEAGSVRVVSGAGGRVLLERDGQRGERLGELCLRAGDGLLVGRLVAPERARVELWSLPEGRERFAFELRRPVDSHHGLAAQVAVLGDVDGDGEVDLALYEETEREGARLALRSGADGRELWRVEGAELHSGLHAAGDFDGDGVPDLCARSRMFTVVVHSGADGRLLHDFGVRALSACALGDLDGDGRGELALAGVEPGEHGGAGTDAIRIHAGGSGALLRALRDGVQSLFTDLGQGLALVGDLDGDGLPDLAAGAPTHDDGEEDERYGRVVVFSTGSGAELWARRGTRHSYLGHELEALDGGRLAALLWLDDPAVPDQQAWAVFEPAP